LTPLASVPEPDAAAIGLAAALAAISTHRRRRVLG
jgi:MYXO-CTERM domain-containing protein